MLPKTHILVGLIISVILFFIFPELNLIQISLFFLASFLMDFDHYLFFNYKKKSFSLNKALIWYKERNKFFRSLSKNERKRYYEGFYCFHGLEGILILVLLGYYVSSYFYFVAGGMILHLILDYIDLIISNRRIFKISVIYDLLKLNQLKKL